MITSTLPLKWHKAMAMKRQINAKKLTCGVWVLDLAADAKQALHGPFYSVAEAHELRDSLDGVPDPEGMYIWCIWPHDMNTINVLLNKFPNDTLEVKVTVAHMTMEVVGCQFSSVAAATSGKEYYDAD